MTAVLDPASEKARFYVALQASLIAWSVVSLALGGALAIPRLPLYVASIGGMLFILWRAMHHPTYIRLRTHREDKPD